MAGIGTSLAAPTLENSEANSSPTCDTSITLSLDRFKLALLFTLSRQCYCGLSNSMRAISLPRVTSLCSDVAIVENMVDKYDQPRHKEMDERGLLFDAFFGLSFGPGEYCVRG
ncbi:hypothetical protein LTR27_005650 [Elasticomyces elasticus]|nr:hypothetical protein LTR27_005650 [Elasticomyces elasticus]